MIRLNEMTDEELALSYVRGNNQAFDLLLSRNQSKLFSYISPKIIIKKEELISMSPSGID